MIQNNNCASKDWKFWGAVCHLTPYECRWEAKCLPVVSGSSATWVRWCSGINNERKATTSLWLLCGSEEALRGWVRLMKSTRESIRAPSSQRCNQSRSPRRCSEAPLLSCSAWCSLNDLQISLISQGSIPPGSLLEGPWLLFSILFALLSSCWPRM